jgi:3-hydroxybutyryl-CoA dehydrogenase
VAGSPRSESEAGQETEDEEAGYAGRAVGAAGVIGVVGAGTMGAGIAQLAACAGARTFLHDPIAEALERGARQIGAR